MFKFLELEASDSEGLKVWCGISLVRHGRLPLQYSSLVGLPNGSVQTH